MGTVDRFEGRCWLDWWANSTTNLAGCEVSLVITPTETGWDARGRLGSDEDQEAFAFLCELDPVFTLRFSDGSTVDVVVTPTDHRWFTLVEYTGSADRQINYRFDL